MYLQPEHVAILKSATINSCVLADCIIIARWI